MDPDDLHSVDSGKKVCLVLPRDRDERISWGLRDQGDHVAWTPHEAMATTTVPFLAWLADAKAVRGTEAMNAHRAGHSSSVSGFLYASSMH
jgi:hypothetical protein